MKGNNVNHFAKILDMSRNNPNETILKIVSKIDMYINMYNQVTDVMRMYNDDMNPNHIINMMAGYDKGIKGEEGYSPIMYSPKISNPYEEKQTLLIKITTLFELLEEHYNISE